MSPFTDWQINPAKKSSSKLISESILEETGRPATLDELRYIVRLTRSGQVYSRGSLQHWAPQFTLFSKLPVELRLKIWKYAMPGPRLIELTYHYQFLNGRCSTPFGTKAENQADAHRMSYVSKAPIPALLHTCSESREQALKRYTLSLGYCGDDGKVYVDFSRDIILLSSQIQNFFCHIWSRGFPDMEKIKYFAVRHSCTNGHHAFGFWIQGDQILGDNNRTNALAHLCAVMLTSLRNIQELAIIIEPEEPHLRSAPSPNDPRPPVKGQIRLYDACYTLGPSYEDNRKLGDFHSRVAGLIRKKDSAGAFVYPCRPRKRVPDPNNPHHTFRECIQLTGNPGRDPYSNYSIPLLTGTDADVVRRGKRSKKMTLVVEQITDPDGYVAWKDMSKDEKEEARLMEVIKTVL